MNRKHNNRRTFELEADECFVEPHRIVEVDNSGDADHLIYGQLALDDRDRFEGWGLSRFRVEEQTVEGSANPTLDDYESYRALQAWERRMEAQEERISRIQGEIASAEQQLRDRRNEARDMKREYGSISPSLLDEGQRTRSRVEKLERDLQQQFAQLEELSRALHQLENCPAADADTVDPYPEGYNTVHWNLVFQMGERLISTVRRQFCRATNEDLLGVLQTVKQKRTRKELTFRHYVQLTGLLNAELYRRTGAICFRNRREQMAMLWKKHDLASRVSELAPAEGREILVDPTERQYADMGFSESVLVDAIDLRSCARRLSLRHHIDFETAVEMLLEQSA